MRGEAGISNFHTINYENDYRVGLTSIQDGWLDVYDGGNFIRPGGTSSTPLVYKDKCDNYVHNGEQEYSMELVNNSKGFTNIFNFIQIF